MHGAVIRAADAGQDPGVNLGFVIKLRIAPDGPGVGAGVGRIPVGAALGYR
jgi:hypothetical protein